MNAKQSDHSCPDDHDRTADASRGPIGRMHGDRYRFDHRGVFEGERIGDWISDILGDGYKLSEGSLATKLFAGDPEDLAVLA